MAQLFSVVTIKPKRNNKYSTRDLIAYYNMDINNNTSSYSSAKIGRIYLEDRPPSKDKKPVLPYTVHSHYILADNLDDLSTEMKIHKELSKEILINAQEQYEHTYVQYNVLEKDLVAYVVNAADRSDEYAYINIVADSMKEAMALCRFYSGDKSLKYVGMSVVGLDIITEQVRQNYDIKSNS